MKNSKCKMQNGRAGTPCRPSGAQGTARPTRRGGVSVLASLLLLAFLILNCPAAQTNTLYFPIADIGQAGKTNVRVTLTLLKPSPRIYNGLGIRQDPVWTNTLADATAYFTNILWGNYRVDVAGVGTSFPIFVGTNTLGLVNGWTCYTNAAAVPPDDSTLYYTKAQVDALLAGITGSDPNAVTNHYSLPLTFGSSLALTNGDFMMTNTGGAATSGLTSLGGGGYGSIVWNGAWTFSGSGGITANQFVGSGAGLTSLPANQLSGTIPMANLDGRVVTNANATLAGNQITTGDGGRGIRTTNLTATVLGSSSGVPYSATAAQIGGLFSGGSTYLKADGTTGTGGSDGIEKDAGFGTNTTIIGQLASTNATGMTNSKAVLVDGGLHLPSSQFGGSYPVARGTNYYGGGVNWWRRTDTYPPPSEGGTTYTPLARLGVFDDWGGSVGGAVTEWMLVTAPNVRIEEGFGRGYGDVMLGNEDAFGNVIVNYTQGALAEQDETANFVGFSHPLSFQAKGTDANTNDYFALPGILGVVVQSTAPSSPTSGSRMGELWFQSLVPERVNGGYAQNGVNNFRSNVVARMRTNDFVFDGSLGIGGSSKTFINGGTVISTNRTVANTALTLDGSRTTAASVIDYTTNGVSKFSVDTTGLATAAYGVYAGGNFLRFDNFLKIGGLIQGATSGLYTFYNSAQAIAGGIQSASFILPQLTAIPTNAIFASVANNTPHTIANVTNVGLADIHTNYLTAGSIRVRPLALDSEYLAQLTEEFFGGGNASFQIGELGWRNISGGNGTPGAIASEANHPGIFRASTAGSANSYSGFALSESVTQSGFVLSDGDGAWTFIFRPSSTNNTDTAVGFCTPATHFIATASPNTLAWNAANICVVSTNGSPWYLHARNAAGGPESWTTTGVASQSAGWVKAKFRWDNANSTMYLSVNNSAEVSVSGASLPSLSALRSPVFQIITSDTNARDIDADFFWAKQVVTR